MSKQTKTKKIKAWAIVYIENGIIQQKAFSSGSEFSGLYNMCFIDYDKTAENDYKKQVNLMNGKHRKGKLWKVVPCTITLKT